MVEFSVGNILKLPQLLKIPELAMTFITLLVFRLAGQDALGDPAPAAGPTTDAVMIQTLACVGFFFIVLVQTIALLLGDKSPVQDVIFALCGFLFYLGGGAKLAAFCVDIGLCTAGAKGSASMMIITSILFLIDAVFALINLKNA